ncbi:MAG: hypothetical protein Q6366_008275 [Candidatus Freyarchaeota archaeon]
MERKISMRIFSIVLNSISTINKRKLDLGFVDNTISRLGACIRAAFFLSNGIRKDTVLYIIIQDKNYTIKLVGSELRYLGPDIRSTSILLMKVLGEVKELNNKKVLSKRGAYIFKDDADLVDRLRNIDAEQVIFPNLKGRNIEEIVIKGSINCIVPLEYPFPDFMRNKLVEQGYIEVLSSGNSPVDNFIIMVQNWLDNLWGNGNNGTD